MAKHAWPDENMTLELGSAAWQSMPMKLTKVIVSILASVMASVAAARDVCGPPDLHFEFQMSPSQQSMLLSQAASVPSGASIAVAIAKLGKPDYDAILAGKEPPGKFIDHGLTWYAARVHPRMVGEFDRYVELHFTEDGRLTRTSYHCL